MSVIAKVKKHFKDAKDERNKSEQEQLNRPPKKLYEKLGTSDDPADREEFQRLHKKYGYGYLGPDPKEKNRIGKKKTSMDSKDYKVGGGISATKKVKPLTSEILSAADKRRRKEFMAKSKKPINLRKKKLKTVMAASGGLLKAAPNKGVTKLPQGVRNNMGFMKKGGAVKKMKKCRMDGIALRGKTRAKQRSK